MTKSSGASWARVAARRKQEEKPKNTFSSVQSFRQLKPSFYSVKGFHYQREFKPLDIPNVFKIAASSLLTIGRMNYPCAPKRAKRLMFNETSLLAEFTKEIHMKHLGFSEGRPLSIFLNLSNEVLIFPKPNNQTTNQAHCDKHSCEVGLKLKKKNGCEFTKGSRTH